MHGVDEPKRVLRFAHLALRTDLGGRLRRAGNVFGALRRERNSARTPSTVPERLESDSRTT
ncbi:hypothetical protein A3K89_07330 [Rhodococcoides kyotonense]|uniref:Uncharacterized protein n=1 Tax=Rhodococcoides kyotonense TaxID=398843 RepID=A0A177YAU9_9NOCA|nr:hypothetical protein A3K89_07330 [Rhodococcus kyotonensis]